MFFTKALTLESVKNVLSGSAISTKDLIVGGRAFQTSIHSTGTWYSGTAPTFANSYIDDYYQLLITNPASSSYGSSFAIYGPFDLTDYKKIYLKYLLSQSAESGIGYYEICLTSTHVDPSQFDEVSNNNTIIHNFTSYQQEGLFSSTFDSSYDVSSLSGNYYIIFRIRSQNAFASTMNANIVKAYLEL